MKKQTCQFFYVLVLSAFGLFGFSFQVNAQCGAGIPSGGNPNCIPPDVYHRQGITQPQMTTPQRPIIIRHKWADRWGAIIADNMRPVFGVSRSASTENEAIESAKRDCFSKGGGGCKEIFLYRNQCAVFFGIKGGGGHYSRAESVDEAEKLGMEGCSKQGKECVPIYSACSLPEAVPIH